MLRITPQMASKWVKAAFLVILAIVILYFSSGLVDDLKRNSPSQFNVEFDWTWDLLAVLLWILVAWLLVDAVIIIVLSLRGDAYTLADVMDRLRMVEKRVAQLKPKTPQVLEQAEIVPAPVTFDEEEPPPPGK
jgi:hypothetical protein